MSDTPRVWVGCLACYNAGNLVGEWFDATDCPTDLDEFNTALQVRVKAVQINLDEPGAENWASDHLTDAHEELWVFDHEGFEGFLTGECSPMEAQRIAADLEEIDSDLWPALAAYLSNQGETLSAEAVEGFQEAFCGYWSSEEDYTQELASDVGVEVDDQVWPYTCIDWAKAWRELTYGGDNWSHYVDYSVGYAIFRDI